MKLLEKFKSHLISKKSKPSKVTIKNYLSDVRKFIQWFENQSHTSFNPKKITIETINFYKTYLNSKEIPVNSIERYLSSLRRFFSFLMQENLIIINPFNQEIDSKKLIKNQPGLDQFKIYLLSNNISKLTIKNYLMDIRQFLAWLEKIIKPAQSADILKEINELVIDEYRDRLLYQARMSPASVNRKLSSLRKYTGWLGNNDIKIKKVTLTKNLKTTGSNTINKLELFQKLGEQNNKKIHENVEKHNTQPQFNLIDFTITLPIVRALEKLEFFAWKIKGAEVFTPTQGNPQKNPSPQYHYETIKNIHNISKSVYSPLKISTKSLPRHQKIYFHLRHTRPKWYKKYHSYAIAHYFHAAILIIFTTATGAAIYNSFYENSPQQKTVFASPPWIKPRILAFQGKLSDANNNPITTTTPLRFTIYNSQSSSGSALLWQEVQAVNPDTDGMFKTQIGQKNPISSSIFSGNPALYLGMTVGNDKELQPRQEFATVSYSNDAQQLQGLLPITKTGAGTNNVILALDSAGNLSIGGKASPTFEASGGQFTISGKTLLLTSVAGSDGSIKIAPDGNGIIDLQKPLQNTTNNNNIESAQGAVEIDDLLAILATSSGQSAFTINQNSTGPLISASTSGTAMFTLENNGTGIFAGNLFINGDSLISTNTSFNLLNTDIINLNIGNAATNISLGASTGSTTINNTLITSDINPLNTGAYNLGSSENRWNNAYIDNLYTSEIATVSGFWQRNKGTVSPFNPTDNLIIAGTATGDAKFQIFGSGTNAGTASTSGQLTFTNNSQVNLLNNTSLGFYNSISGDTGINSANPSLYLASNGNIGIGTNNPTAKLQVKGDIRGQTIYATTTQLQQADLAENYISAQFLEAGDIIMPEGKGNNLAVTKTTKSYEPKTLGIVSTKPGIILNSDARADNAHPYVIPIALSGRVPVKVTTQNGPIQAGDYLTTSGIPGVSMKAIDKGMVIGKALEDYTNPDPNTIGKILLFANLSFYDPSNSTGYYKAYNPQDNYNALPSLIQTLTQAVISNIQVGFIQAQKTVTDSLTVTTENITIGSQTLKEYITEIIQKTIQSQIKNELANSQLSTLNSQLSTNLLSPLASESAIVLKLDHSLSATETGQLSPSNATPSATYITNVTNIYNAITATSGASLNIASNSAKPGAAEQGVDWRPDLYLATNSALLSSPAASNSALPDIPAASDSAKPDTNLYHASNSALQNTLQNQSILDLIEKNPQITNDYANLSSLSGLLTYIPNLNNLSTHPSTFNSQLSTLQVLGPSTLSDVAIVGNLNVGGSLILADNAINTLGSNLELQPLRQGNLSVMGGLLTIDTNGNLKALGNADFAKNVTIKGKLTAGIIAPVPNSDLIIQLDNNQNNPQLSTFNSQLSIRNASGSSVLAVNQLGDIKASGSGFFSSLAAKSFNIVRGAQADTSLVQTTASSSAGTAVITAYETERTIMSPFVTKDSLIYLTAASNTQGLIPYIARQTEKDFTIAIPYVVNKDIKINWWIIN